MNKIATATFLTALFASSSNAQGFSSRSTTQSAYCYTNPVYPANAQVTVTSSDLATAPFTTTITSTLTPTYGTAIITDPASTVYARTATVTTQGSLIAVTQYAATSTTFAVVTSTVTAQNQCQGCYTTSTFQLAAASNSASATAPKKREVEDLQKRAVTGTAVVQCTYLNVVTAYTASGTPQVYHSTPIVSSGTTTTTVTSAMTTTVFSGTTTSTATTTVTSFVTPCCPGIGVMSSSTTTNPPINTTPAPFSSSSVSAAGPLTTSISGLPYACSPIYPAVTTQLYGAKYVCNAN